ncbi:Alpha/Beta hydrolase protein [Lactifluus volemus]|nr:Alpha/Beta hydrolase protein [Lactifluus volemus]
MMTPPSRMNPADPCSFNHRTEQLSTGRTYHFVDEKPANCPDSPSSRTILCIHGFPDIWYGWRYQIGPWVEAGYRVVVPDMLGYGGTDKPLAVEEYSTRKLCADLAALLDVIGVSKAVVIGHDWGSHIAGRFALWHPDRLLALGLFSVPFTSPSERYMSLEDIVKMIPNYAYQLYFANPESTKEIEANLERFLRLVYGIGGDRSLTRMHPLTEDELKYVASQMRSMNGPLSYYRRTKLKFEEEKGRLPSQLPAELPVLHIWGDRDPSGTPEMLGKMREAIAKLKEIKLGNMGHWIMVEASEQVVPQALCKL